MTQYWNIGCQFILHVRDIYLTPETPNYETEEWHVLGQSNEHVCATAAYICSTTNISSKQPPSLAFRRRVFTEEAIASKGKVASPPFLPEIHGAKRGEPAMQIIGQISLRESRMVVWRNIFQTCIESFSLEDPSEPGRCRALLLHLTDPNRRILSTSVPCLRCDWWAESVRTSYARFRRLPEDVFRHIIEQVDDFLISTEEGERIRKDFREERDEFQGRHTAAMENYEEWDFWGEPGAGDGDDDDGQVSAIFSRWLCPNGGLEDLG